MGISSSLRVPDCLCNCFMAFDYEFVNRFD